jgi:uncharacterized membrane protein YccC
MYGYSTHSHLDPGVRASDTDREQVGERLRRHHAEGRIDAEEFQDRIDRCYKAKTIGDLRQLVNDLPREHEEAAERSSYLRRLWRVPLVPIILAIWVISILTGWHHGHWGLLWLIPLFFAIRWLLWPYSGWGMRRRYRFPRDL